MEKRQEDRLALLPGASRGHPDQQVRGRLLDNDLLHVFMTVALCGGFTSAAHSLHRTQAAVSMQIRRLEDIVQARLLRRSSRGVDLTPKGKILYRYAQKMLAINEEVMLQLHSHQIAGPVRVGTYHHFAADVLPEILTEFNELYPEVWVELHVGLAKTMPSRLGGDYDIVVGLDDTSVRAGTVLKTERVSWYTSTTHHQHENDPLPIAVLPEGSLFRKWAIDSLSQCGLNWRICQVCTSAAPIETMVAAGLAIGVFKEGTVSSPLVRPIGPSEGFPALPNVNITIETSADYCSTAAQRLRDYITYKVQGESARPDFLDDVK